jgi:hypothetical protein
MTSTLSIVFFIFFAVEIVLGVFVLLFMDKVEPLLKKASDGATTDEDFNKTARAIELFVDCKAWNNPPEENNCKTKLNAYYNKYKIWVAVVLFVLSVVSVAAMVFCCRYVCCSNDSDDDSDLKTMNTLPVDASLTSW